MNGDSVIRNYTRTQKRANTNLDLHIVSGAPVKTCAGNALSERTTNDGWLVRYPTDVKFVHFLPVLSV